MAQINTELLLAISSAGFNLESVDHWISDCGTEFLFGNIKPYEAIYRNREFHKVEAMLVAYRSDDRTHVNLNMPGVWIKTDIYGDKFEVNTGEFSEDSVKRSAVMMTLQHHYHNIISKVWHTFGVPDEVYDENYQKMHDQLERRLLKK